MTYSKRTFVEIWNISLIESAYISASAWNFVFDIETVELHDVKPLQE
jgi:hypothetical protein